MDGIQGSEGAPRLLPALKPPPGVIPNFVNPESNMQFLIVTTTCFTALAGLFVAFRMYTRLYINRSAGSDDCQFSADFIGLPSLTLPNADACLIAMVSFFAPGRLFHSSRWPERRRYPSPIPPSASAVGPLAPL